MLAMIRLFFGNSRQWGLGSNQFGKRISGLNQRTYIDRIIELRVAQALEELRIEQDSQRQRQDSICRTMDAVSEKFVSQFRRERELKAEILALGHHLDLLSDSGDLG